MKSDDEKTAEFWEALTYLIGDVAPIADEAGVGISILLDNSGRIEVRVDPMVPQGMEQYRLL